MVEREKKENKDLDAEFGVSDNFLTKKSVKPIIQYAEGGYFGDQDIFSIESGL